MLCQLCRSEPSHNFHHLIPRSLHANKWFKKRFTREQMREGIDVCRQCHHAIHDLVPDEKELGRHYHTLPALLAHPELSKYVAWKRQRGRRSPSSGSA
jgi:hypothetical protein